MNLFTLFLIVLFILAATATVVGAAYTLMEKIYESRR
jgi:hypothetical protein